MIIILNGIPNAGKSTIARILTREIPNTANLEIDYLVAMLYWMPVRDSMMISIDNAISLARNFVLEGLNVVITYPFTHSTFNYLLERIKPLQTPIWPFTLCPPVATLKRNRGTRELWPSLEDRIEYLQQKIAPIGLLLDNSFESPEETARRITDILFDGRARRLLAGF